jgi:hypothetical protein
VIYCSECGDELKRTTVTDEPAGHIPGEAVRENETPAACTEPGRYDEVVFCTKCGEELSRDTVETGAAGHDWGEWKVTKEADCTREGIRTRTYSRCGETETLRIRPTGHDWGDWVVTREPAASAPGERTRTCRNDASHVERERIPAGGEAGTGDEDDKDIVYTFTKGDGSKWTKGSEKDLPFTVSRNTADSTTFSRFTGILVDDKSVDPSSYAADPGSLNVSLRPDFLETLSVGEHTITAVFDDGRADAGFTIVKKTSGSSSSTKKRSSGSSSGTRSSSGNSGSGGKKGPMTGDTAPVAMWAAIAAAAAAGIGILVFLRRKTKHV